MTTNSGAVIPKTIAAGRVRFSHLGKVNLGSVIFDSSVIQKKWESVQKPPLETQSMA
jgi:hypothetical protein